MTLHYKQIGSNPDGTPHFEITSDSENPHFVVTGQFATGAVELPDGTTYDVTPPVIEVESHEHAGLVAHAIGVQHEETGRLGPDFKHDCDKRCGHLNRNAGRKGS